jgi:alpha-D-xyloside xylohydrolase
VSIPVLAFSQAYKKYNLQKDHLSIQLSEGVLNITPLSDKAVRIQWEKGMKEEREFVLINKLPVPHLSFQKQRRNSN